MGRAGHALAIAALWAANPGCLWIGAGDRSDRLGQLDEDGDGVLAADEVVCGEEGDLSPDKSPSDVEIPYDGIDNDCQGGDLIDADGDGYPGISEADYETVLASVPANEAEVFPAEFVGKEVDCLDDPNRSGGDSNPGVASDLPYNGVDGNCDGANEFDLDGDGYVKAGDDLYAAFLKYEEDFGYDFPGVQPGDCDDDDPTVHPGIPAEDDVPYDGRDADCAGNDDFDADGDGWYPAKYQAEFETYRDGFDGTESWIDDQPGDCFDTCVKSLHDQGGDPLLPPLPDADGDDRIDLCDASGSIVASPGDVNPAATEIPYDGVDGNCDQVNDYDADGDAYASDAFSGSQIQTFFAWWGGDSLATSSGDCDDTDPSVNPGQVEVLDGLDQDCFGAANSDTAAFRIYDGATWTNPGQVNVVRTDPHWVLTVPADHFAWPAGPIGGTDDNTFLLSNLLPGTVSPGVTPILFNRTQMFPGNDLVADGDTLFLGMTYLASTSNTLAQWSMLWDGASWTIHDADAYIARADSLWGPALETSVLEVGPNEQWAGGCGDDVVWMVENGGLGRQNVGTGTPGATACVIEDDAGSPRLTSCSNAECRSFEFDATANVIQVATPPEWAGNGWARIERRDDVLAMVPPTGIGVTVRIAGVDSDYLTDENVLAASATQAGGDLLIAAVVQDSPVNRVILLYSTGPGQETRTDLGFKPWPDPAVAGATITGDPQDVSIGVFGSEVLVAATATGDDASDCSVSCPDDDQVGWLTLQLQ